MPAPQKRRLRDPRRTRPRKGYLKIYIERIPPELKQRLNEAAAGSNLNDTVVAILASHFGTPFVPSGRSSPIEPKADSDSMNLAMPASLHKKINDAAYARGRMPRAKLILEILDAELDE